MAFKPTEPQKNAIDAHGTVLVAAAAGSGKTAVLVKRVVDCMLNSENAVPADRILVATFTNSAASEMRTRIENELNERLEKDKNNHLIERQLLLMPSANICTIDAFCIELVREFFNQLDVSPDFKPVSADAGAIIGENVMNTLLSKEFESNEVEFLKLLEDIGADFGTEKISQLVCNIHNYCSSLPYPAKWRETAVSLYEKKVDFKTAEWVDVIFDYISDVISSAKENIQNKWVMFKIYTEIEAVYGTHAAELFSYLDEIYTAANAKEWDVLRGCLQNPTLSKAPNFSKKNYPDLVKIKENWCDFYKKTVKSVLALYKYMPGDIAQETVLIKKAAPVVRKLMSLVDKYESTLYDELLASNMLSFSDCERLSLKLLSDESDVGAEIRERFDYIMVDEYQDTNKLQDELFAQLSKGKNNLFMVGDIKQSIYKFRHANPEGFLKKKNTFKSEPSDNSPYKIVLDTNFRSREGICDFINFLFSNIMSEKAGEMDYLEEDSLKVGADFPQYDAPSVDMALIEYDKADCERIEAEAKYIGKYILDTIAGDACIRDENDKDSLRKARFGDFTILMRSFASRAGVYAETLRAMGIPVSASSGSVLESNEAKICMALFKVIANPARDIPLFATMTSPLFGFSYDEISEIRASYSADTLYASVILSAKNGHDKSAAFLETISKYSAMSIGLSVNKFLLILLEETGLLNMATAMSDGARRRAGLLSLVHIASELDYNENAGLSEIIERIERADSAGVIKTPALSSERADSVNIMTIHASKGLQFPVCIIANCAGKLNETDLLQDLMISEKYGAGIKLVNKVEHKKYSTAVCEAIKISERRSMIAEELRLLYVALTRAEEKLLICISDENTEKLCKTAAEKLLTKTNDSAKIHPQSILEAHRYSDWLLMTAALSDSAPQLFGGDHERVNFKFLNIYKTCAPMQIDETLKEENECEFSPEIVEMLRERFSYVYPYKALNDIPAKIGVSQLVGQQSGEDYSFTALPSFLSSGGLTPAQRGSALHKFMEFAEYDAAEQDAQSEIARIVRDEYLSVDEGKAISVRAVESFFESELYKRIKNAALYKREVRFLDEISAGDVDENLPEEIKNEPVVIQGVADLIFEEDEKLIIVDYKTDHVKDINELVERYGKQLKMYAKSAEKSFEKPILECIIYSFGLNDWVAF